MNKCIVLCKLPQSIYIYIWKKNMINLNLIANFSSLWGKSTWSVRFSHSIKGYSGIQLYRRQEFLYKVDWVPWHKKQLTVVLLSLLGCWVQMRWLLGYNCRIRNCREVESVTQFKKQIHFTSWNRQIDCNVLLGKRKKLEFNWYVI